MRTAGVVLSLILTGAAVQGQTLAVPPLEAASHLKKRVPPVYPELAKEAKLQGVVTLEIQISRTGDVTRAVVIEGPQLLRAPAVEAAKGWTFQPFESGGEPAAARTEIEMLFSLGAEVNAEIYEQYLKQADECRGLVAAEKHADAAVRCMSLAALSERMPKDRQIERVIATRRAGQALIALGRFAEAVPLLTREVELTRGMSSKLDLARAHQRLARASKGASDVKGAQRSYDQAESAMRSAQAEALDRDGRLQRTKDLHALLTEYVTWLRESHQTDAAEKVQARLDAVAKELQGK